MKMQEAKNSFEKATERLKNDQKITEERQNFELDMKKEKIDFDRMHDEKTLKKYRIDTTERIYSDLGLKEIKINQFTGSGQSGLGGLLPSLSQS
jgi:(p)ppGpp synthase/HD superfamily hydrolase